MAKIVNVEIRDRVKAKLWANIKAWWEGQGESFSELPETMAPAMLLELLIGLKLGRPALFEKTRSDFYSGPIEQREEPLTDIERFSRWLWYHTKTTGLKVEAVPGTNLTLAGFDGQLIGGNVTVKFPTARLQIRQVQSFIDGLKEQ